MSTSKEDEGQVEMPGHSSFSEYIAEGYKVVVQGVKSSGGLPSGRNYQFYLTYTNFRDKMKEKLSQIQDVIEDMMRWQGLRGSVRDVSMEDATDSVMTLNDKMLDRATKYMDLMEGIKTGLGELVVEKEVSGSWNRPKKADKAKVFSLSTKRNIPRPQFTFKDKINNNNTAWEPQIRDKPNSLKPLAILLERTDDGDECFSHPYEFELEMFTVPEGQLSRACARRPADVERTPLEMVDSEPKLEELVAYLREQPAIAVDLENHSYRSFLGFTCLMQISTREKDFLVDALSLRHALHSLNQVFTDPKILKVFHGADQDIVWLQRDFGVYVVNMFDTHQGAKLLGLPKLSLAHLLSTYCGVDANKHFQLFDWRIRPLPEEAIRYAREDTHYLLYIADLMTNQLLDKANGNTNILKAVYEQSKQVCLKRFEKLVVDEETYMSVYRKSKRYFDNRQLFALKALYLWRDKTARELDESLSYVLPDAMMLNVAENLPREVQGILACCNPVPPLVKGNLLEIHYLLVRAKEQPLVKICGEEGTRSSQKTQGPSEEQVMLSQWYYPPGDIRDDLPTLLGSDLDSEGTVSSDLNVSPALPFFSEKGSAVWHSTSDCANPEVEASVMERLRGLHFASPYQRYVRVLPYSAQMERERRETEAREAEQHRARSRQQHLLAMEIKSLQESGLIKLKKEESEIIQENSLKIQLMKERKRPPGDDNGTAANRRKRPRRDAPHSSSGAEGEGESEVKPDLPVKEERSTDAVSGLAEAPSVCGPAHGDQGRQRPATWKQLRQMKQQNIKPFDYNQVDFSKKFGGGRGKAQNNPAQANNTFDKKRKWKNNPGAQRFSKKKRKRNPVV